MALKTNGAGVDQGVYFPTLEHGRTVHCNSYYNGLVSGGITEAATVSIQEMVGVDRSGYPVDKGGACRCGGGGGDMYRRIGGRER